MNRKFYIIRQLVSIGNITKNIHSYIDGQQTNKEGYEIHRFRKQYYLHNNVNFFILMKHSLSTY